MPRPRRRVRPRPVAKVGKVLPHSPSIGELNIWAGDTFYKPTGDLLPRDLPKRVPKHGRKKL